MNKKEQIKKIDNISMYIMRIIGFPFLFCYILCRNLFFTFYVSIMFTIYGGEILSYAANEKKCIYDIWLILKNKEDE